jgi:hypothetical protein
VGGIDRWEQFPWNTNPWAKQRQAVWRERALDPTAPYPLWQRVGMVALGAHRKTGRAEFDAGELAQLLGVSNQRQLANAMKKAKEHGWLDCQSDSTCLIVPAHAVHGGL